MTNINRKDCGDFFFKFYSFFHCTCIFCGSFLDPKLSLALLPPSLCVKSSHLSCPALVAAAWHQHNEAPAQQGALPCLWTDFFLSQGFFFHISHVIPCSPEEHHPLLLLRRKKKISLLTSRIDSQQNWSHQLRSSGFSHNPHFFKMLSSINNGTTCSSDSWNCPRFPQNERAIFGWSWEFQYSSRN